MYACINKKKQGSYLYRVIKNYLRSIHLINVLKKFCDKMFVETINYTEQFYNMFL